MNQYHKTGLTASQYQYLHLKVRKAYGAPNICESCEKTVGKFEWACIGVYEIARKNWKRLCTGCHRTLDFKGKPQGLRGPWSEEVKARNAGMGKRTWATRRRLYGDNSERNHEIQRLHTEGVNYKELSNKFNLSLSRVYGICKEINS